MKLSESQIMIPRLFLMESSGSVCFGEALPSLPKHYLMAGEQQMDKAHMKIQLLSSTHEMSVQALIPGVLICCFATLIGRTEK